FRHFGMSSFLGLVTIIGVIGVLILLYNLEKNLHNGIVAKVVKISNRKGLSFADNQKTCEASLLRMFFYYV
ncbi:MAG: hypothetical protein J6Q93_07875, partial [Prevotella sp.]|nr:hypothetical protein [Prevotella sp.]